MSWILTVSAFMVVVFLSRLAGCGDLGFEIASTLSCVPSADFCDGACPRPV